MEIIVKDSRARVTNARERGLLYKSELAVGSKVIVR
jgi:hypothetical protein